jgi:hypothetical protein
MPVGIIFMKWDDRIGVDVLAKYPDDFDVNEKTLRQIYNQHEYHNEPGIVSLKVSPFNLSSYYSGPLKRYYVILALNMDEDSQSYESVLIHISHTILQNLRNKKYLRMIPSLFDIISNAIDYTYEQQLAFIYQDEIKRLALNRLREEGLIEKSEFKAWIADKYRNSYVDVESKFSELIKAGLIKEGSIVGKDMSPILIFFTYDIMMFRIPPLEIRKIPNEEGLSDEFFTEFEIVNNTFFKTYQPSEKDNLKMIEIFLNPQLYDVIKILRKLIVDRMQLENLVDTGFLDIEANLKTLEDNQIIYIYKNELGEEYYSLFSDFYIDLSFPKYVLNVVKSIYIQKSKTGKELIEYLNILEKAYIDLKSTKDLIGNL